MPTRPPRACDRCGTLRQVGGDCPVCRPAGRREGDQRRGSAGERGYDRDHDRLFRRPVLKRDPICRICHTRPSTVADHYPRSRRQIEAAGDNPNDPEYGRGLCAICDRKQTARRQPGGWAQRRRST